MPTAHVECLQRLYETSGGSKNVENGDARQCISPSSFIANAHNELYAVYTEKAGFF